jgi:sulfite exporter TauE/SafE
MVAYDSKVFYDFADRLYKRASRIVLSYAVVGAVLGFVIGGGGAAAADARDSAIVVGIIVAVLFGAAGFSMGQEKAFTLRLQAQTALCQAKIEENTRPR